MCINEMIINEMVIVTVLSKVAENGWKNVSLWTVLAISAASEGRSVKKVFIVVIVYDYVCFF